MSIRAYDNIQKISDGQGDDYATVCLLDCLYSKIYYKITTIYLIKKQALDDEPKVKQKVCFT